MKRIISIILLLSATLAFGADQRIQYNEKMVGAGHPSLSDTLNRLSQVEHDTDGTHKYIGTNVKVLKAGAGLNAEVAAVGSTPTTFLIVGEVTLSGVLTTPSTLSIVMEYPGKITKVSGTLTINGPFSAGLYQVFSGFSAGDVTFGTNSVSYANPIWFGLSTSNGIDLIGDNRFNNYLNYNSAKPVSTFNGGAGVEWTLASGSAIADETTNYLLTDKAIKLTTSPGGTTVAKKVQAYDLSSHDAFRFLFYVDDRARLAKIRFAFLKDASNYYYLDIEPTGASNTAIQNGWNSYSVFMSEFTVVGSPIWANITELNARIESYALQTNNIVFNEITSFKNQAMRPTVIITFDDGNNTDYTEARKVLDKYRYSATSFLIPNYIGSANYLSLDQVLKLQNENGWDMGIHGDLNLTTLTQAGIETEITKNIAWAKSNGVRFVPVLAYPNGAFDTTTVVPSIRKFVRFARTVSAVSKVMPMPITSNYVLRTGYVNAVKSLATAQGYIDDAVNKRGVLVLTFHKLSNSPTGDEWSISDFGSLVDYIATKDIDVMTFSQFMKKYYDTTDLDNRYVNFKTNTTGAGTPQLGTNSPASVNTAPYTWIQTKAADGTIVYLPAWK